MFKMEVTTGKGGKNSITSSIVSTDRAALIGRQKDEVTSPARNGIMK